MSDDNESPNAVEWGDTIEIPPDYPLEMLYWLSIEPGVRLGTFQRKRLLAYLESKND